MKETLIEKIHEFTIALKADKSFDLQDEIYFQVLGHVLFGYAFGYGRTILFLDVVEIKEVVIDSLVSLGAAKKYSAGLVDNAHKVFLKQIGHDVYDRLINIGHDFSLNHEFKKMIETIDQNTKAIKKSL